MSYRLSTGAGLIKIVSTVSCPISLSVKGLLTKFETLLKSKWRKEASELLDEQNTLVNHSNLVKARSSTTPQHHSQGPKFSAWMTVVLLGWADSDISATSRRVDSDTNVPPPPWWLYHAWVQL